ncbi:hypothetical protein SSX86_005994 [Deinandra increscens subsp. villosa]|uniref:Uncharacterized protein n=1 Tax=Deinandra increscens subsp. villosa TaxID=3103831 RepID=A0AAP0DS20_9ASTR
MGGGRSPCCDKSKVKRGPWSPAEDVRLVSFIQKHGHPNWRSLPKQAGLLRCGKSCRLRWINYLRPDVKRGNFTLEEEHSIIRLHATFGNKWAKIASHLPGRTDNEIKNIWNTHLKKRSLQLSINANENRTHSLSSASGVSNEFTNIQENTLNQKVTEKATGEVLVEDVDQPSTSSSTISCNTVIQGNASSGLNDTHLYSEEEIFKNNLDQVPLEYEVEFWDMLEPQVISDYDMLEVENWVRLLEKELGPTTTATASQQNDQDDQTNTMGQTISHQISPFWPTSPNNLGW